jgi:hypothetical protein
MKDIFHSEYILESNVEYFLYIGELKNYFLNSFLAESLSRIHSRKFDFIAIVPDVHEKYFQKNLIVLNPDAQTILREQGYRVCCRLPGREFMSAVSKNEFIIDLVQRLKSKQDQVFIYMYESLPEMTLDKIPGVSILGPDSFTAHEINNKIYQFNRLSEILPMPEHRICDNLETLINDSARLLKVWTDGIFVTEEYSAAGAKSIVAHAIDEIKDKFQEKKRRYLISRFIPHKYDPTVLAVAANENDVYVAGVADQRIEQENRFTGSTFPTELSEEITNQLVRCTRKAGKWLASNGYRGIFGCDFIVDNSDNILFLEVNARKQGTTMEFCCTLEQSLPANAPNLPELEYFAVTQKKFPDNTVELFGNPKNIHWGTYNYKIPRMVRTKFHIPQQIIEREAFKKIADGEVSKDYIVLEHTGSDFIVAQGAFVGRIVALGSDSASVKEGIAEGRKILEKSICEYIPGEEP